MFCPKCLSTDVTEYQYDNSRNAYWYYKSSIAKLVHVLFSFMQRANEQEFGTECVCNACGNRWHTKRDTLYTRYDEILTKYLGAYSTIHIKSTKDSSLRLCEDEIMVFHLHECICRIPYDEITAVVYQKSLGPLYGWMSLRDRANNNKPFPVTFTDAQKDKLTILYDFDSANSFYQIHLALKEIVEENQKAGLF